MLTTDPRAEQCAARAPDAVKPAFEQLAARYALVWKLPCALANAQGYLVAGSLTCSA